MSLLKRDGIKLEEVDDYKIYPIADNDTPKLSADRFEYTFSSGLTFLRVWELDKIRKMYNNIVVTTNEDGTPELAFKDKEVCEEYIDTILKLWTEWGSDKDRTVMQFLADMCKSMNNAGYLTIEDLYTLSEQEVINKILTCEDKYLSDSFKLFKDVDTVYSSTMPIDEKYCVNVKAKKRYVVPLVQTDDSVIRINQISDSVSKQITEYLKCPKGGYYTYFDFQFVPYNRVVARKFINKDNA